MEDFQETQRRRNGGSVYNESYSDEAINRLKEMILTFYQQNKRKLYSILVDGEIVVKQTSDGRKFDSFRDFVSDYTKKVEVRMYMGNSPNCNRYIFRMGGALAGMGSPVQVDVQSEIKKALEEQRLQNKVKYLQKKVTKLQGALNEAPKVDWDKMLEKAVGAISLLKGGNSPSQLRGTPLNSEVTVESEGVETSASSPSTESDAAKAIFNSLLEQQGIQGMLDSLAVLKTMKENPEIHEKVRYLINTKKKRNGQA